MTPMLVIVAGYFTGAIPFGVLLAKYKGIDIRERGSGNIGATNVARVLGLGNGLVVLVLDALKGAAAVWLAIKLCGWEHIVSLTGFAAILGHCFSPFLSGKGGKGVATALGVFLMIAPALAFVAVGVFLLVAGRTRVPALGSLTGIASATLYAFLTRATLDISLLALATLVLLVYTHRGNLAKTFGVTN